MTTRAPDRSAVGVEAVHRPPRADVVLLVVALTAVSTSGPIIAAITAPALGIAFWRNAMASGVLLPVVLVRRRAELASLDRREWRLALIAGALLAGHFAAWIPSLSYTSVASATALVATQPVWAALLARLDSRQVGRRVWTGILVAVAGAAMITGADLSLSARAVGGDLLAVLGGILAAAYVTAGAAVRVRVSTTAYTTVCYSTCAVLLVIVCLVFRQPLTGYSGDTWIKLAALTAGAQLLGHSLVNVVLRTTSPTVVSLAILFEAPGAAIIAAVWLDQLPPVSALPGIAVLLAGLALVIRSGGRAVPVE